MATLQRQSSTLHSIGNGIRAVVVATENDSAERSSHAVWPFVTNTPRFFWMDKNVLEPDSVKRLPRGDDRKSQRRLPNLLNSGSASLMVADINPEMANR